MITPKEIQTVRFANAVRGYSKKDVDEFLDQLTIDYQNTLDENRNYQAEIAKLQKEIEDQKRSENSVMNTLEQAKRLMNDISESAEKRAEVIIKNANLDAESIIRNAKDSVMTYTEEAEMMQRKITKFREKYRDMLNEELSRVDQSVDDLFEGLETEIEHQRAVVGTPVRKTDDLSAFLTQETPAEDIDLTKTIVVKKPTEEEIAAAAEEPVAPEVPEEAPVSDETMVFKMEEEPATPDLGKTMVISKSDLAAKAKATLSEDEPKDDILAEIDREIAESKQQ